MNIKTLKRITFGMLALLVVVLASATITEKLYGTEWVHDFVYGRWWFVVLWAIFALFSVVYTFKIKFWKHPAAFALHSAFLMILVGAFITYISSERGYVHVRQGEKKTNYISGDGITKKNLPFEIKLVLFNIKYHSETPDPEDYISYLKIDDEICQVSMNKILVKNHYRLSQYDYDADEMGTVLLINRDPWGIGITYSGYILLAVSMIWLLWLRIGWKNMLGVLLPTAAVWFYISRINPMTPILRTPMLAAHVSVIMISYSLLIFIMITGIVGLCSKKMCEKLYRLNSKLLYPALFLLTAGIFIGAVWANISWGRYWGWDAKETWALITLLIYAVPMHKRSLLAFERPRMFHTYCVLAFLAVAMTFFGVTYLLGGIHSYV